MLYNVNSKPSKVVQCVQLLYLEHRDVILVAVFIIDKIWKCGCNPAMNTNYDK